MSRRALLDTHAVVWFCDDNPKLSVAAREVILDRSVAIYVSVATCWELAMLTRLGRFKWELPFDRQMSFMLDVCGAMLLPLELDHLKIVSELPMHHRDPFDRMLIAQATADKLEVITVDEKFRLYSDVHIVW